MVMKAEMAPCVLHTIIHFPDNTASRADLFVEREEERFLVMFIFGTECLKTLSYFSFLNINS